MNQTTSRVFCVEGVQLAADADAAYFDLGADLRTLERYIEEHEARLCIIDPMSAYLPDKNSHNNADIRSVLGPLAGLAERQRCAVVAVTHLNKATSMRAMYRAIGSIGFVAQARMAWVVCRDPKIEVLRLLLPLKSNLAKQAPGMAFAIMASDIPEVGRVAWSDGPVDRDVDEVLGGGSGRGHCKRDEAKAWLRDYLSDGPVAQRDIEAAAKDEGFSLGTLRRAKKDLGLSSPRQGYGKSGNFLWALPSGGSTDAHTCATAKCAPMDDGPENADSVIHAQRLEDAHLCADDSADRTEILVLKDRLSRTDDPEQRAMIQTEIDDIRDALARG